jgi:hypothetical protein
VLFKPLFVKSLRKINWFFFFRLRRLGCFHFLPAANNCAIPCWCIFQLIFCFCFALNFNKFKY